MSLKKAKEIAKTFGTDWVVDPGMEKTRRALVKAFAGTETPLGEPVLQWATSHTDLDFQGKRDLITFVITFA